MVGRVIQTTLCNGKDPIAKQWEGSIEWVGANQSHVHQPVHAEPLNMLAYKVGRPASLLVQLDQNKKYTMAEGPYLLDLSDFPSGMNLGTFHAAPH